MKITSSSLSALVIASVVGASLLGTATTSAERAPIVDRGHTMTAPNAPVTADPLEIPASLQASINAAIAACQCFSSVTPWEVIPIGTPADVFRSQDVLFAILDLDIQLPWVAAGEINSLALATRLAPSGQKAVLVDIANFADPSGGGFRLGAYRWSHPTAPDFCSGETLYLMYFPNTGVLFAWRFDSSSEC